MRFLIPFLLLAVTASTTGCLAECESPNRLDGSYVVWSNVMEHEPAAVPEDYPARDMFYNGWSEWSLAYDSGRNGFDVLVDDQGFFGSYLSEDTNCNAFHMSFEGTWIADDGDDETEDATSNFTWEGDLTAIGIHLGGAFTYKSQWTNPETGGAGSVTTSGEMSGSVLEGE